MARKNSKASSKNGNPDKTTVAASLPDGCKVRVRMYRQGLGDSFLLTFPGPVNVLIDCGVVLGATDQTQQMQAVVANIAAETGKHLDVLIVTHEHWDHVSGFVQARDGFNDFKIDELWYAWTENPNDELANQLRAKHDKSMAALRGFAARLQQRPRASSAGVSQGLSQINEVMGFWGAAKSSGGTTRDALEYLGKHPSKPRIRYHRPNDVVPLPGVKDVRAFVLGPPHDEKLIRRINPSKSHKESYGLGPEQAYFIGCSAADGTMSADGGDVGHAFSPRFRLKPTDEVLERFFDNTYNSPKNKWRKIDDDWLSAGEELALALDSYTNNTSLALAFELEPDGDVLLFPGDAQVGNWESWQDCSFATGKNGKAPVTAVDLLKRTTLYKVGHHASHNATMREHGLELMESPDLIAMVPVHHEQAVKKKWDGMPFPILLDRLMEKTRGRVLRIDDGVPKTAPSGTTKSLWADFLKRVHEDKLFLDYLVH
jgi:hypothetical protein